MTTTHRCERMINGRPKVRGGPPGFSYRCTRAAVTGAFCRQHAPVPPPTMQQIVEASAAARAQDRIRDAAPDLLAACEALMGLVETAGDFFTDDEQDAQTIRDARAAIRKARGTP